MRDILFRGKSTETNQWCYGGFHIWKKRQICVLGDDKLKDDEISYVITVNSVCGLEYAANNASR